MPRLECPREADVLLMVSSERWPDAAPEELRAHAAACELCADVARAAGAIADVRAGEAARIGARLPSAGTVWWRAQLRARQEAARAVVRPIGVAQVVGVAALAGMGGAVFGATAGWFQRALRRAGEMVVDFGALLPSPSLPDDPAAVPAALWVALAGVGLALAAVAAIVGWAFREE